jgi:hypothetical protein
MIRIFQEGVAVSSAIAAIIKEQSWEGYSVVIATLTVYTVV